jgi:very-short-patch-repair endonuclease
MSKKLTQKEVLDRFKKVHGDEYDYSLVEYEGGKTKVLIKCKKEGHSIFKQRPDNHSQGQGCPKCKLIKSGEKRTLKQQVVIDRFKKVHGDEFDYSLVDYKGGHTNVIIICYIHGNFTQRPSNHLFGKGCPDCGILKRTKSKTKTLEKFIDDAKLVHGDEYDYSLVEYVNQNIKISIKCKKEGHEIFKQKPTKHLQGDGCPKCGRIKTITKQSSTKEYFIKKSKEAHPNKNYGYHKVDYNGDAKNVIIVCPLHGDFEQTAGNHLAGKGCQECANIATAEKLKLSVEEFIERSNIVHNNFYGYEKVVYEGGKTKVIIVCPVHGDFPQNPSDHLHGKQGCPRCKNKNEGRLAIILNEIGVVHRNYRINNRYFDFYLPEYNLIIERDGEQHYGDIFRHISNKKKTFEQNHQNDIEKTKLAKSKGHKICRIPYWLSKEDERKEIQNILDGNPTYPDVPDLEQAKTKPLPI